MAEEEESVLDAFDRLKRAVESGVIGSAGYDLIRLARDQIDRRLADSARLSSALTGADVQTIVAAVVRAQGRRDWRTDAALVVAILSLIVAWLAYQQDRAEYARPDPPPSPPVVVQQPPDPAEIDRRVDERLREIEQQRQAEDTPTTGSR